MSRLLDPILGPDGKRLWVATRDYIGAEEVNAACDWTQRVHAGLTNEHAEGEFFGHHGRAFHAVGAVRFVMPRWISGEIHEGWIYPDSVLFDKTEEEAPGTFQIQAGTQGLVTFFMNPQLPTTKYWVQVHSQPHPVLGGYRRFRFLHSTRLLNSFQLEAYGSPSDVAARGDQRIPLVAAIYAERRG